MNKARTNFIIVVCVFFISNCSNKEKTFFGTYKQFKITTWEGERFVSQNRSLTGDEKIRLKKILDIERVVYKDTLNAVYISNKEFYDDPQLLFSSYTDFLLDSNLYDRQIKLDGSTQKSRWRINQ